MIKTKKQNAQKKYLEKKKINKDSIKEDHKDFIKSNNLILKTTTLIYKSKAK